MLNGLIAFPIVLGVATVLQSALNKKMSTDLGLPLAILINSFIVLLLSIVFYFYARVEVPNKLSGGLPIFWWYLIPGVFGMLFITGVPFAISKIGALEVFIGIVAGQIVASILWDLKVENIPLNPTRVLGSICAVASILLVSIKK